MRIKEITNKKREKEGGTTGGWEGGREEGEAMSECKAYLVEEAVLQVLNHHQGHDQTQARLSLRPFFPLWLQIEQRSDHRVGNQAKEGRKGIHGERKTGKSPRAEVLEGVEQ